MSKRKAYSIEFLQKIKSINPEYKLEGEDLRVWTEWVEKEKKAEDDMFKALREEKAEDDMFKALREEKAEKRKSKKVNQVVTYTDTESLDSEDNEGTN